MSANYFFQEARGTDASNSVFNSVGRNQYIHNHDNSTHVITCSIATEQAAAASTLLLQPFNDAPVDLLSSHFTGRAEELDHLSVVFDTIQGDVPTRCAIHGMPGLGKTQLALQYAKSSSDRQRYSFIFWISGTTIDKLNQGFGKMLHLVGHPDPDHVDQNARLTAARRWLEECPRVVDDDPTSGKWLLIFDNVVKESLGFLREHLPRRNPRGNILFTTRTGVTAEAVVSVAGQRHQTFELRAPDLNDAVSLLLKEAGTDTMAPSTSSAEDLVKCIGCLPLAISHAGSFMKQSHQSLEDLLILYQSQNKYQVGVNLLNCFFCKY